MMKLLKLEDGNAVIQDCNRIYIYAEYAIDTQDLTNLDPVEDHECSAIVEMLPCGKLKVEQFSEAQQFNCSGNLLNHIKLIAYALEQNWIPVPVKEYFDRPQTFSPVGISDTSFIVQEQHGCPGATFKLKLNSAEITGSGTFIKYWFFDGIEKAITSVEDLLSIYVAITKLTAAACYEGKDTMFLQCDDWVCDRDESSGWSKYSLKPGILR
jgi:hypothetical protein